MDIKTLLLKEIDYTKGGKYYIQSGVYAIIATHIVGQNYDITPMLDFSFIGFQIPLSVCIVVGWFYFFNFIIDIGAQIREKISISKNKKEL